MSVTDAPQITAAPQEMRTPILPRPARCGFEELEPKPHTIAETISASTDRMRPTVITAPTMSRSWSMPGRPELLGSMSITAELLWTKTERWFCHQRSEEHTSELQSRGHLVCLLLLEKKKNV